MAPHPLHKWPSPAFTSRVLQAQANEAGEASVVHRCPTCAGFGLGQLTCDVAVAPSQRGQAHLTIAAAGTQMLPA